MTIRLATPKDEEAMASLCALAWFNDGLFGPVMHPYRDRYPDDVKIYWHECLRRHWKHPREHIIVAVTTEDDQEKVVGTACWQRQGNDKGAEDVQRQWVDVGPDAFPPLASTHNRAMDYSKRTLLEDSFPHFRHHWDGDRAINWYLTLCGVHPDYQGKGFGRELVQWGLALARAENVHASVVSSLGNEAFYIRSGFDEVVANCGEGEGNPMAGIPGGNLLFMWPKDHHGVNQQTTP